MKLGIEMMQPGQGHATQQTGGAGDELSAAWLAFIRYCRTLGFGEIERLKIQDGVPVLAEVTTRKIKFT